MNLRLIQTIKNFKKPDWDDNRKAVIEQLVAYILKSIEAGEKVSLNFICTHNSRRSQISQIWGQALANYFDLPIACFSGGVEVTEFNSSAAKALADDGFVISKSTGQNPQYSLIAFDERAPILAFSKCFDDPHNPTNSFAAIMTCDHADETCPFIPGAAIRLPLRYDDPKFFDGTAEESKMYSVRSQQIGAELYFCFQLVLDRLAKRKN